MGKPLTIQIEDDERIDRLKSPLKVKTKIDVIRKALDLLEDKILREQKIKRWSKVVQAVVGQSLKVNHEFQKYSLLKRK